MLLVALHGGNGGCNNLFGFSTKDGNRKTKTALSVPPHVKLDEIRDIAVHDGHLFVVNGSKHHSSVMLFKLPPDSGPVCEYLDTVIGPGQAIMHPFGITFMTASSASGEVRTDCYVSNQDSNVIAQIALAPTANGVSGSLGSGSQSAYLNALNPAASYLDGTFVASQFGNLAGVAKVAPSIAKDKGGLGVSPAPSDPSQPVAPSNSVRGVAAASGILFACDEVNCRVSLFLLGSGADSGKFLGAASTGSDKPTHVTIAMAAVWVSAGKALYWGALPASAGGSGLTLRKIAIPVPDQNTIGGISFDANNAYVVFQHGTHGTGTGAIGKFTVIAGTPPTLAGAATFATISEDTPEFCLFLSDSDGAAT